MKRDRGYLPPGVDTNPAYLRRAVTTPCGRTMTFVEAANHAMHCPGCIGAGRIAK